MCAACERSYLPPTAVPTRRGARLKTIKGVEARLTGESADKMGGSRAILLLLLRISTGCATCCSAGDLREEGKLFWSGDLTVWGILTSRALIQELTDDNFLSDDSTTVQRV